MRPPRLHPEELGIEQAVIGDLRHRPDAPDQTAVIMRRLGYARISGVEIGRRQRRRQARRVVTSLAGGAIIGFAALVYSGSDAVRRPVVNTVPAAVQKDLIKQQQRLDRTIRAIRGLSPTPRRQAPPPAVSSEPLDGQLAIGPVRWL